jgi:hypothetical protein
MPGRDTLTTSKFPLSSPEEARAAFRLEPDEAGALWRTPEGSWVVVARGQSAPFVLNDLAEWEAVACEHEVALTADADGRVHRRESLARDDLAWVIPDEVRARALA